MKDGNYWINDKSRYGWEVVRVISGKFYRFGIQQEFSVEAFSDNHKFIEVKEPITSK